MVEAVAVVRKFRRGTRREIILWAFPVPVCLFPILVVMVVLDLTTVIRQVEAAVVLWPLVGQ